MKAFNIIEELTKNSYDGNTGTFIADAASTMYPYLVQLFGKDIEVIYDMGNIFRTPTTEMRFFYMYDVRLDRKFDKEIYAIIKRDDDLIYIYKVD
jgi:hypothetical protein